ncbi:hypothetical protein MMC07_009122 [Pseudocyphellaria aurata]|nr:hypothetical protein [Pseudocyphellaria aurata]
MRDMFSLADQERYVDSISAVQCQPLWHRFGTALAPLWHRCATDVVSDGVNCEAMSWSGVDALDTEEQREAPWDAESGPSVTRSRCCAWSKARMQQARNVPDLPVG